MKYINASEYHVTMELSRDDCEMLADACQRIANEGDAIHMEAIATMFTLAIEATKHAESEGQESRRNRSDGPDVPPAFYD